MTSITNKHLGPNKDTRQPCGYWRVWFFYVVNYAGPYRYWTTLTSNVRHGGIYIRSIIGCSWWGNIWGFSKQAWNTGTLYDRDEQQARGVVTCTHYLGLQTHCSHTSILKLSACTHKSREQE